MDVDIGIHQKALRRITKAEVFHSEHRYILLEADKAWQGSLVVSGPFLFPCCPAVRMPAAVILLKITSCYTLMYYHFKPLAIRSLLLVETATSKYV